MATYDKKLHPKAILLIKKLAKKVPHITCPSCGEVVSTRRVEETYERSVVEFDNGEKELLNLVEYVMNDGGVAREQTQAVRHVEKNKAIVFIRLLVFGKKRNKCEELSWSDPEMDSEVDLYNE